MNKVNYDTLLNQIKSITESETNKIANLSNSIALIHESLNTLWTGFYCVEGDELVLGPFQGPVALQELNLIKVCVEKLGAKTKL